MLRHTHSEKLMFHNHMLNIKEMYQGEGDCIVRSRLDHLCRKKWHFALPWRVFRLAGSRERNAFSKGSGYGMGRDGELELEEIRRHDFACLLFSDSVLMTICCLFSCPLGFPSFPLLWRYLLDVFLILSVVDILIWLSDVHWLSLW